MAAVGILGGTFNPPHIGHLVCAQEALVQLALDEVLLMPVCAPTHKAIEADPGAEHRVAMCRAAVAGDPRLGVSLAEIERGGPSFTVDTLNVLHAQRPDDEVTWIMGGDMAYALPDWRQPARILELARIAVAERHDVRRDRIAERLAGLPGADERVRFFDMPRIDVSSSLLRQRAASGGPLRYLMPDAVRAHIEREALYR